MNFSTSGDNLLVFSGTSASPSFLHAIANTPFTTTSSSNNTEVPTGLTAGTSAVAVSAGPGDGDEFDNIYYSGSTSFTNAADAFAAINDSANWTGSNTAFSPVSSFTIPEPTTALLGAIGTLLLLRRRR
ncbi:MAG: hypothetical protein NWT08_11365 [Akkermansiaceae bacterium]|jgi:hypothetical protein|nr:hypothetical protein [Akkermansiaceae bacterium]MDP4646124.1 hypothetical protein [Akkermansiaceae bacterium]MDP4720923.1 hypothetical protein [Akkermansiaceae bacterium]MDP4780718.1 hypothetical protein [Akkermansiaceae bacterium]MDP4845664.1 hypothetical protein [Akkermansiaceae bacterium]